MSSYFNAGVSVLDSENWQTHLGWLMLPSMWSDRKQERHTDNRLISSNALNNTPLQHRSCSPHPMSTHRPFCMFFQGLRLRLWKGFDVIYFLPRSAHFLPISFFLYSQNSLYRQLYISRKHSVTWRHYTSAYISSILDIGTGTLIRYTNQGK